METVWPDTVEMIVTRNLLRFIRVPKEEINHGSGYAAGCAEAATPFRQSCFLMIGAAPRRSPKRRREADGGRSHAAHPAA